MAVLNLSVLPSAFDEKNICIAACKGHYEIGVEHLPYSKGAALSHYMIFLPRDLVQTYAAQKVHDVLASVVLRFALRCEAHEDDGHAGEEAHEGAAGLRGFDGVARDLRRDVDDGEGDALLDDDSSLDGHGFLQSWSDVSSRCAAFSIRTGDRARYMCRTFYQSL